MAFAGAGMALTTWMRSWQDFEFIQLAIVPMFLFSATFYPLSTYPDGIEAIVSWTPLYQGVVLMPRAVARHGRLRLSRRRSIYLAVMGTHRLVVAGRRIGDLLLK